MARKKNLERVAALTTHIGDVIIIGSDPSKKEVLAFVEEHNRRYHAGEPGGPSGIPAYLVQEAAYYESQDDLGNSDKAEPIDIKKYL